jgi:hypothetical protein
VFGYGKPTVSGGKQATNTGVSTSMRTYRRVVSMICPIWSNHIKWCVYGDVNQPKMGDMINNYEIE